MKKKIIFLYILGIFFQGICLHADVKSGAQNFAQQMQSFGSSIKDMFKGMGSMFGAVPAGYQCNWEIINDSDQEIDVYYQNFVSVMGGFFPSKDDVSGGSLHAIQPYSATFPYSLVPAGTFLGGSPQSASSSSSPSESSSTTTSVQTKSSPVSDLYNGVHPYFALFMGYSPAGTSTQGSSTKGTVFYKEYQLNLGAQYDNSINYYHVYTGKRFVQGNITHMTMVEMAGSYQPDTTQPDAAGNIAFSSNLGQVDPSPTATTSPAGSVYVYNTLSQPIQLEVFFNDGTKYLDISLEPSSYNLISCLPSETMNGSTLKFGGANPFKSIIVPAMTVQGNNYIFEIYQDLGQASPHVGIQGFNPGNYDICVHTNMRDISSQKAILLMQSVAQQQGSNTTSQDGVYDYDLPGQVWMVYQSASVTTLQKVALGSQTALNFIRPSLADQVGYLYFIYVDTQKDDQAKAFINNFLVGTCGGSIKKHALATINTPIDIEKEEKNIKAAVKTVGTVSSQENMLSSGNVQKDILIEHPAPIAFSATLAQEILSGSVPANIAQLQDSKTGLTGYFLGIDVFTPYAGQLPPISYYQLLPAKISFDTLAGILNQYLDQTKIQSLAASSTTSSQKSSSNDARSKISAEINAKIALWLGDYRSKGSQAVQSEVVSFLVQYGAAGLFDSKGSLTKGGLNRVKSFVNGSISLANPPILYSIVSAQNPAYEAPGMPAASAAGSKST